MSYLGAPSMVAPGKRRRGEDVAAFRSDTRMNDQEYAEFMNYLFERYVRPRIPRLRSHLDHHMKDDVHYHLGEAERSARILRFIESDCDDDGDIYGTFKVERLARAISETRYSLSFSNRITEEGGFLEAYEEHETEILQGLQPEHLPKEDKEILREMGSMNPEAEIRGLVYLAKARLRKVERQNREVSVRQELKNCAQELDQAEQKIRKGLEMKELEPEVPKKSRRWFKGLGQIAQGSALSIADVALAIGVLKLPVSAETQTWGAIASVTTGIGTVLNGVGDLRNE